MNIERVLVPVDFSPPSNLAVNYGISLARKFRATLTLLHVVEPPTALMYAFPTGIDKAEKQRRERAERMLSALVGPEDQDDLDVRTVVKSGEIEEEIYSIIRDEHTDIVVMGTHGRRLLGRWFIGSVTQNLLRNMTVPVLTVCRAGRPLAFERILFATDLSEASFSGFRFVTDLASSVHACLILAHVMDKRPAVSFETPEVAACFDEERRSALELVHDRFAVLETEAHRHNLKPEKVIAEGVASDAILRIADEQAADFIVMTVEKKGAVARALLGTTAERLIRESHVPVLSIPATTIAHVKPVCADTAIETA
jgi:nucleotide-binding universal stress UspA family protein